MSKSRPYGQANTDPKSCCSTSKQKQQIATIICQFVVRVKISKVLNKSLYEDLVRGTQIKLSTSISDLTLHIYAFVSC